MGMTGADFSNKNLGAGGAIIIAAWLTHRDKGALSSLNLSSNDIGAHYVRTQEKWVATPEGKHSSHLSHPSCSHCIPYVGPAAIAEAIKDNGALSPLSLKNNKPTSLPPKKVERLWPTLWPTILP
jgi:hypothetical protein